MAKYENTLTYVKTIIKERPVAPRESDLGQLIRLAFKSFRGKVFWGMGIVFVLSGIGIIFTLVNLETTILGVLMALFGLGLIAYPVYSAMKIYNALEAGVACLVPSSRVESNEKGMLSAADVNEFQLTQDSGDVNMNLRESDNVLALVEPETNRILVQFNMIWEISG